MVAKENLKLPPQDRIGGQTDEADRLAAEINETFARMVGAEKELPHEHLESIGPQGVLNSRAAVARHSKPTGKAAKDQVRAASVLILTHASYVSALHPLQISI
jgi:hypothetical protein